MLRKLKCCILGVTLAFAIQGHAGLYIEPAVGLGVGGKIDLTSEKPDLGGTLYGLKLGYNTFGLAIGGEYSTGEYSYKTEDGTKYKPTPTDLGLFVSYKLPILLKVQASYFLSSELKSDIADSKLTKGSGTKIGFGFTGFPIVAINVDYQMNEYKSVETAGTSRDLSNKIKTNMVIVSVSAPFSF